MISRDNTDTYFCKMISNVVSQLPSLSSAGSLVSRSVVVSNQRDLEECASGIIRVWDSQWIPPLIYSQIEAQSHTHESPGDYFLTAPNSETEMSWFWWNFHHWLHWKLSFDNFLCSHWWKFHQNVTSIAVQVPRQILKFGSKVKYQFDRSVRDCGNSSAMELTQSLILSVYKVILR